MPFTTRLLMKRTREQDGALPTRKTTSFPLLMVRSWECPFYHRVVGEDECYDLFMIATRAVRDEEMVKEKDRDALSLMCDKCKNYLK